MTTGYSGTPLVKKLGYTDGMRVWFDGMPDSVRAEIYAQELTLSEEEVPTSGINAAHIFVTSRKALEEKLEALRKVIDPTEDTIREIILPDSDLVDVKVCAVDEIWSGLKLVVRKERR
jgi:hypothetical protein